MRSKRLSKFSNCFLFLMIGFLMPFSPCSAKAQSISTKCEWVWKWVWVWENEYNGSTGRSELMYVYRYRYVYDCAPTLVIDDRVRDRAESSTDALAPSGKIQKVWVDHDVYDKQIRGMRIHFAFTVRNVKDKKCKANAYFYYASGKPLKDLNGKFRTTGGNVAMHTDFIPTYSSTVYKDFQLFMPNDELEMATGKYDLKFNVQLKCEEFGLLAESEDYTFSYSRSK